MENKNMKKMTFGATLAAILCNLLFGTCFPLIKLGYKYFSVDGDFFSVVLYAGIRFTLAGIILLCITAVSERKPPIISRGNRINVITLAILYVFLQYVFFYMGVSKASGATSSVVSSTSVFMTVVLAHFIYKDDRITAGKLIGSVVGTLGVALFCLTGSSAVKISFLGEGFMLIASFVYVLGTFVNKKATKINSPMTVSAYNLFIGGLMLLAVGLFGYRGGMKITLIGVIILVYLALVSSVAFTILSTLFKKYPIGRVSVFSFVIPISGTFFSALLLGEEGITPRRAIALLLVAAGIACVNLLGDIKYKKTNTLGDEI